MTRFLEVDEPPPFQTIFHPTDCSAESRGAFAHALRLAVAAKAELVVMHVDAGDTSGRVQEFPRVRPTLEQWGLLPPGSTKADVGRLGLLVKKVRSAGEPAAVLAQYVARHATDVIVLGTSQHEGLDRWRHTSVSEPIARRSRIPTLFVPAHCAGFVDAETGRVRLRRVVVPVGDSASGERAGDLVVQIGRSLGVGTLEVTMVHCGHDEFPPVRPRAVGGWTWRRLTRDGALVSTILDVRGEAEAELIVTATQGHDSLGDTIWGSTAEQVVRGARCPVMVAPILD